MDHHPTNGGGSLNGVYEPTQEELERELPRVFDGQVPLGDLLSRVVQSIYAELSELAETFVWLLSIPFLCPTTCVFQNAKHAGYYSEAHSRRLGCQDEKTSR